MQLVADCLGQHINDYDTIFVFPSEVTASFWRKRSLSLGDSRAVKSDRFISWDIFKERVFVLQEDVKPANNFIRLCFAADLLKRNAEEKRFLNVLLHPEHAGSWRPFVSYFARMLPSLEPLLGDSRASKLLKPPLRNDLEAVNRSYKTFLNTHRLFEPLHMPEQAVTSPGAVIFFSDVIMDFAEYSRLFDQNNVTVIDGFQPLDSPVLTYSNARVEVRQTCLACRRLLDAGVAPSAIAITLAEVDGYQEELRDLAACYDIPLAPRLGKPLAEYVEVRIYRLLSECVSSGFSVGSLKKLFLNSAYPWRDKERGRRLIRFGIDNFGIRNGFRLGREVDEWQRRITAAGKTELLEFYRRFKRSARSITNASSFPDLRTAVMAFNTEFLDTAALTESQSYPFSAAIDLLFRIEDKAIHDLSLDSPFSLWMLCLADRRYVRQVRDDGIPVYEYRVAAGICPDYHYILGLSQESSIVEKKQYHFLPVTMLVEDMERAGDFTVPFYRLYEHSGGEVVLSTAAERFAGPATPARYFPSMSPAMEESDAYVDEVRFWSGGAGSIERIYPPQLEGLEYITGTGFKDKGIDFTANQIENPALARRVNERFAPSDGLLRVSPTNLDTWTHCRFRLLLGRGIGLEEADFDTVYTSPRESGILFHRLFAEALRYLSGAGETAAEEADSRTVSAVLNRVFTQWIGSKFLEPVRREIRRRAEHYLRMFLASDRGRFPHARIFKLEDTLETVAGKSGAALYGRIDRISEENGNYIIIDYKTHVGSKRAGMVTAGNELYSYQVPLYVLLVEAVYGPVAEALYYDIDKASFDSVFGGEKPWFDDTEREDLLRQTDEAVIRMLRGITGCDYKTPLPKGGCAPCEFRPICREKYRVR